MIDFDMFQNTKQFDVFLTLATGKLFNHTLDLWSVAHNLHLGTFHLHVWIELIHYFLVFACNVSSAGRDITKWKHIFIFCIYLFHLIQEMPCFTIDFVRNAFITIDQEKQYCLNHLNLSKQDFKHYLKIYVLKKTPHKCTYHFNSSSFTDKVTLNQSKGI
jgi:hypothetical protein